MYKQIFFYDIMTLFYASQTYYLKQLIYNKSLSTKFNTKFYCKSKSMLSNIIIVNFKFNILSF